MSLNKNNEKVKGVQKSTVVLNVEFKSLMRLVIYSKLRDLIHLFDNVALVLSEQFTISWFTQSRNVILIYSYASCHDIRNMTFLIAF